MSELEKAQNRISELEDKLAVMSQQLDWLKRQLFGKKSEAGRDPNQIELALELSEEENEKEKDEAAPLAVSKSSPSKARRPSRAQRLPDNLPVREQIILPLCVQAEPEGWRHIDQEVTDQLEKEPGYFYLRRTIRPKFVKKDAAHEPPVIAPAPPSLIPGGFYGAGLTAEIVLEKFLDHLPLYRLEQRYLRQFGVHLSRKTMSDTIEQVAMRAAPVVLAMEQEVWKGRYVQMDETPIRFLDPEKPGGSCRGWLWTVAGPPGGDVIFRWEQSRGHEVLMRWLPADFEGTVQRDAYSAYAAAAKRLGARISWAGCWAHVRRRFYEAMLAGDRVAQWFVRQIALLYALESQAREKRPHAGAQAAGTRCAQRAGRAPAQKCLPTQIEQHSAQESAWPGGRLRARPVETAWKCFCKTAGSRSTTTRWRMRSDPRRWGKRTGCSLERQRQEANRRPSTRSWAPACAAASTRETTCAGS